MSLSTIEWTDYTFNPWWGCEKVSPGCAHCYADTLATRRAPGQRLWGAGHDFRFFGDAHWAEPLKWARLAPAKLGRRPRVFCASMADVFEPRDELKEHRQRLYRLIEQTPELDWLILTKRPEIALVEIIFEWGEAPSNIWMGVSIENVRFTWRADVLRQIPAAVRFISAEPLLGSLITDEERWCSKCRHPFSGHDGHSGCDWEVSDHGQLDCGCVERGSKPLSLDGIDWVIVGGESGHGARPMHPEWAREVRRATRHENVAFFFKQWGEWAPSDQCGVRNSKLTKHRFEFESNRFAPDGKRYRANEPDLYSYPGMESLIRVGKKRAGRLLDGIEWSEWPDGFQVSGLALRTSADA